MLKKIAVAMVAAGGLLVAAVPAHAAGHVSLSLGLPLPIPGVYVAPAPTYYGPPVVYDAPPVVYTAPVPYPYYGPGYYGPRVVYRAGYWHGGYDHRVGWRR